MNKCNPVGIAAFFKVIFLMLLIVFASFTLKSQPVRITIQAKSPNDQYNIATLKEKGVLIFFESNPKDGTAKNERWIFAKYDTTFNELWTVEYPLFNNMTYNRRYIDENYIYILFTRNQEYQILKIDIETGEIFLSQGKTRAENVIIKDFKVLDGYAFWGGSVPPNDGNVLVKSCLAFICLPLLFIPNFLPDRSAYLFHVSLGSKFAREIPFKIKGFSEVASLVPDTINQKMNVIIKKGTGSNTSIFVHEFKNNGLKNKSYGINTFTDDYQLLDSKIVPFGSTEKLVFGTYSKKKSGAQGIYFSKFKNEKQQFIQYESFTNFQNFFEYLSFRDKERIKRKIIQRKEKGKDLNVAYELLIHDPIIDSNQYIFMAEVYYPQYHTEFRTTWYYGRPVETAVSVFDGWRYTHAFIAALDEHGKLLWDNNIVIQDITSFNLNEKVKIIKDGNRYVAAYSNQGVVQYKILEGNRQITDKIKKPVETDQEFEKVKEEYQSDIEFWYGNYFIAYGTQKINQTSTDYVQKTGTVFYFNKIELKYH